MKFYYGCDSSKIDVTNTVLDKYCFDGMISIPQDPYNEFNTIIDNKMSNYKEIISLSGKNNIKKMYVVNDDQEDSYTLHNFLLLDVKTGRGINFYSRSYSIAINKLNYYHNIIRVSDKKWMHNFNFQLIILMFVPQSATVLEINGDLGFNSLIISSLLYKGSNLVVFELNSSCVKYLKHNRDNNYLKFHVENKQLSYDRLVKKYQINFDTLIINHRFNSYSVNSDMLANINLIIISGLDKTRRNYDHKMLSDNNFFKIFDKKSINNGKKYFCHTFIRKKKQIYI